MWRLGGGPVGLTVGILGSVYGGLGVAQAFQYATNTMWGVPRNNRPNPLRARGRSLTLLGIAGLAFLGTTALTILGSIGGGFLGVYPGLDFEILPIAFAVVIIGGMGSLGGAAVGALLVGLADNFGKALFPEISYFTLYAPMALILAVKPTGLFGRE